MAVKSNVDKNGRSKRGGPFVKINRYEMDSIAYRSLCCTARAIYIEIKSLYNGYNNGALFLSVRDAAELAGVSPNTANKALRELEAKGFIRPYARGTFSRKLRHATQWILTDVEFRNQTPSRDFMRWRLEN